MLGSFCFSWAHSGGHADKWLSLILSSALINLSGGNVPILLVLTAVVALILGMGMPTTAVYVFP